MKMFFVYLTRFNKIGIQRNEVKPRRQVADRESTNDSFIYNTQSEIFVKIIKAYSR